MGKYYTAKFANGNERIVASFSMNRAKLFYEITKLLERFIHRPSGIADDIGEDEHMVDAETFTQFFNEFWKAGWLADINDSFVTGWASSAAGIVENITLMPIC